MPVSIDDCGRNAAGWRVLETVHAKKPNSRLEHHETNINCEE